MTAVIATLNPAAAARRRLSPEESREAALDAARALLMEMGPQAVTLKAVAARIGRTHANLLHHFGSAAGLQRALIAHLADTITAKIGAAVLRSREGDQNPREVVDLTFDAFDREGAGALASWMILSGNEDALDPILEAIHRLVDELATDSHFSESHSLHEETLSLVLMALGDALLGAPMARALGLPREKARELAARMLLAAHEGKAAG
jgi:AcrR family transcriptional regulator